MDFVDLLAYKKGFSLAMEIYDIKSSQVWKQTE